MADIFVLNGEIVWEGGDICIIDGDEDIDQQAYLRAICDLGESVFYDDYGSRLFTYLGSPNTDSNKALIEAEAREAIMNTEGIGEVIDVSLKKTVIDGVLYPYIYAKYTYKNSDVVHENAFRFSV